MKAERPDWPEAVEHMSRTHAEGLIMLQEEFAFKEGVIDGLAHDLDQLRAKHRELVLSVEDIQAKCIKRRLDCWPWSWPRKILLETITNELSRAIRLYK